MRLILVVLTLVAVVTVSTPALAQDQGQTAFTLVSGMDGGQFIWVDEQGNVNPELVVPPGAEVTITIRKGTDTAGVPHNVIVDDLTPPSGDVTNQGEEATYTFTAPTTSTADYICEYHPTSMRGIVRPVGVQADQTQEKETPAPGLLFALVILGAVASSARAPRRR